MSGIKHQSKSFVDSESLYSGWGLDVEVQACNEGCLFYH